MAHFSKISKTLFGALKELQLDGQRQETNCILTFINPIVWFDKQKIRI